MAQGDPRRTALHERRDALIEELCETLHREVPLYTSMTPAARRAMMTILVDVCLTALAEDRCDLVRTWGLEIFSRRQQQGAPLADILRALGIARRMFCRAALACDPPELAPRTLERIEAVFAEVIDALAVSYQQRESDDALAVKTLEARYRDLYQRTPAMMHSTDPEGRIMAVSDRWLHTLEYTFDEVLGRRAVDFLTEESRRRALEINIPRLRVEGENRDMPLQFVKKSGLVIDVRLSSVVVRDERGDISHFLAVLSDVTTELQVSRALRESEERWRALMNLAPLPLTIHRAGVLLWVNDAAVRLMGAADADDLLGKNVMSLVHPDDRELILARFRAGQSTDASLPPLEERYVRLDGKIVYAEATARPILYEGERATQVALIDVTARRQAEEARRLSEAQARVIEAQEEALRALSTPLIPLGDGVLVMPLVGRVTRDRAEALLAALTHGVVAQRASVAIIDVTGVPEADASFAEALVRVASAIRLLGADVVVTGVGPPIARALVELGVDLGRLTTRGTLRDGIALARAQRARRSS